MIYFFKPIDISDSTIANGNSIMLINLIRLGFKDMANQLSKSLNGYLNIYKNLMFSSVKAIDFFNQNINQKVSCDETGCEL